MGSFDKRYYRTVAYWHEEMQRVQECGYSEDRLHGRRRTYPMPPELSETVNYPIQATAAAMMKDEILALDETAAMAAANNHVTQTIICAAHDVIARMRTRAS